MSIESIGRALNVRDARLTYLDRLVLIGIANHDGDGGAWPAVSTLARYSGAESRSVQRSVVRLVELGYVERELQGGGTRSTKPDKRPNRYVLRWPEISTGVTGESPRGVTGESPLLDRGVTGESPRGVTDRSPEPSYEPSMKTTTRDTHEAEASAVVENLRAAGLAMQPWQERVAATIEAKHRPMPNTGDALARARALRAGLIEPGEPLVSQPELTASEGGS